MKFFLIYATLAVATSFMKISNFSSKDVGESCPYKEIKKANIRFEHGGNKSTCVNSNTIDCPENLEFSDYKGCDYAVSNKNKTDEYRIYTCKTDEAAHDLYKDFKKLKWHCSA